MQRLTLHWLTLLFQVRMSISLTLALLAIACGGTSVQEIPRTSKPVLTVRPTAPAKITGATTPPTATATPIPSRPTPTAVLMPVVTIGDITFTVDVANDGASRAQGLSGRPVLDPGTGMLFIFDDERSLTFWMKEMQIPLDMVWIKADCTIVDISRDVPIPEPGQTLDQLPRYSPSGPAQYVLEINAGAAAVAGFDVGDATAFTGTMQGRYGC